MTGSQGIILGLIVLTTWIGSIEASAHSGYRVTFSRFILALVVPAFWTAFVLLLPLERGFVALASFNKFVSLPLTVLLVMTAPIWFIGSIVIWVGAALCGDLRNEWHNIAVRFRRNQ